MRNHNEPLDAVCECGHINLDHVGSEPGLWTDFTPCFKCHCMGFEYPKPSK